jgi:hypothetical protein
MKGGAANCPPAKHCPRELLKQLAALIYSHPSIKDNAIRCLDIGNKVNPYPSLYNIMWKCYYKYCNEWFAPIVECLFY